MGYFRENIESAEGYVPGYQPGEPDVTKLNTNENPYPPSPKVLEAIRAVTAEQIRRYPDPAGQIFRNAAAEVHGVKPDNILCCNGGDDLLRMCFEAFCDQKRPVAYPVPTYSLYPVLAQIQNCPMIEVPFDAEFNLPSRLSSTGAVLTILCNPNAPSGSFIGIDEVASLADELKGVLLIDEAYVDFAQDHAIRLVEQFDNVIILRSMSKGYGLAGLRFGYAIADAGMIRGLMKVKDSYNVDAVAIMAATAAIKDREYFNECVEKICQQRQALTESLRQLGFTVRDSQTNFLLARHSDAEQIYKTLKQRKIYVRYFPYEGLTDKIRITVGTKEQNDRLIEAIKEIIQ